MSRECKNEYAFERVNEFEGFWVLGPGDVAMGTVFIRESLRGPIAQGRREQMEECNICAISYA